MGLVRQRLRLIGIGIDIGIGIEIGIGTALAIDNSFRTTRAQKALTANRQG